jgi:gamma-glutamyl:cysteine ligase YbdK (ATP-grasp superfamily)
MNRADPWTFPIGLMERVGVELEYMIVDRETLDVKPLADVLLRDAAGVDEWVSDVEPDDGGGIGWSNELVNHVIELKTIDPVTDLAGIAPRFQRQVEAANEWLESRHARLLPGAMHPWMDPARETRLWPHEYTPVYEKLDEIFSCRGHGWSNLQSAHLNLPFGNDEEFGRLHAAVRAVLPLLPGLAASSPVQDGAATGLADNRLAAYRDNCRRIPSVTGRVIPEPEYDRAGYEERVLGRIERDLAAFDPKGILRPEWTNARGAIARFDRGSIEIRLLDVQECPAADLAIAELVRRTLEALLAERWVPVSDLQALVTEDLAAVLEATIVGAERAEVAYGPLLRALGRKGTTRATDLWSKLRADLMPEPGEHGPVLAVIEAGGTLATRITRRLSTGAGLREVYEELADCLEAGRPLV